MLHNAAYVPTYRSWYAMIQRSTNPNNARYPSYGGRGIGVCERWLKFENFLADMGERPEGMTIERVDNDGHYEPRNCQWATRFEQDSNKSTNVKITFEGETLTLSEWSRRTGIHKMTLRNRLRRAGDEPPHLFRPVKERRAKATSR